jgi:hypothetical protein
MEIIMYKNIKNGDTAYNEAVELIGFGTGTASL